MINISLKRLQGAATLLTTVIMLSVITLIILFAANYGIMQQKVSSNAQQNTQAYDAAEAGLEFGIVYYQQNYAAITAAAVSGFLTPYYNSSTQNVTLANGSKYTIVYSNPTANNYSRVTVTSTGVSADGTSTRVMSQQIYRGTLLTSPPPNNPLTTKGNVVMSGNAIVGNNTISSTINSAGTVTFSGSNAKTTIPGGITGSSLSNGVRSDVTQNNTTIGSMTNEQFFQNYFGASTDAVKAEVQYSYTNSSNTNYASQLNGKTGTSVWIKQTGGSSASISGTVVIGSASAPVLLVVDGSLNISGNVTIYGFVYVIGGVATGLTGNTAISGGVVSTDTLNLAGNTTLMFNSTVLTNLQNQIGANYFAKVAGTWKDF